MIGRRGELKLPPLVEEMEEKAGGFGRDVQRAYGYITVCEF